MGWESRDNAKARAALEAAQAAAAVALVGLKVALDVQHLYRGVPHLGDRGSRFTLAGGVHVWEAQGSTSYAAAAAAWLKAHGADVLLNDPPRGVLVGPYSRRHEAVNKWGAHVYLACHVNAGGGDYAAMEYMTGTPGQSLGNLVGLALSKTFREVRSCRCVPLTRGQRGAVCVEAVDPKIPAVVCEPFFGDSPRQQAIFEPQYLVALGGAIGIGVASWWQDFKASAAGAVPQHR